MGHLMQRRILFSFDYFHKFHLDIDTSRLWVVCSIRIGWDGRCEEHIPSFFCSCCDSLRTLYINVGFFFQYSRKLVILTGVTCRLLGTSFNGTWQASAFRPTLCSSGSPKPVLFIFFGSPSLWFCFLRSPSYYFHIHTFCFYWFPFCLCKA